MNLKQQDVDRLATADETTTGVFVFSLAAIAGFLSLIVFLV